MTSAFRTIFIALVSGITISQLFTPLSAQAKPQLNTNRIATSTQGKNENRTSTAATKSPTTLTAPTTPTEKVFPQLEICNFTSDPVNYSINGSNRTLVSSACQVWKLNNVALLSFDKLFTSGYQKQTYELSAGHYIFQSHHWGQSTPDNVNKMNGLNLFRFKSAFSS